MGSVKLNNLRNIVKTPETQHTFVDIHMDMKESVVLTSDSRPYPKGKDVKVDYDEAAIRNSIVNIFNTTPGERFLIPEFGINLKKYLFQAVSDDIAKLIGRTVLEAVERWEPRIRVENVTVIGAPAGAVIKKDTGLFSHELTRLLSTPIQGDEYVVVMIYSIPTLRFKVNLEGILTDSGFSEVNSRFV
jgi:phage baseplate assembly protein W